jgi:hypothetical protein
MVQNVEEVRRKAQIDPFRKIGLLVQLKIPVEDPRVAQVAAMHAREGIDDAVTWPKWAPCTAGRKIIYDRSGTGEVLGKDSIAICNGTGHHDAVRSVSISVCIGARDRDEGNARLRIEDGGKPQYCSLKYSDSFSDVDRRQGNTLPGSDREIAHLALNPAEVAAVAAGDDAFLEYLGKHCLMKGFLLRRGE